MEKITYRASQSPIVERKDYAIACRGAGAACLASRHLAVGPTCVGFGKVGIGSFYKLFGVGNCSVLRGVSCGGGEPESSAAGDRPQGTQRGTARQWLFRRASSRRTRRGGSQRSRAGETEEGTKESSIMDDG